MRSIAEVLGAMRLRENCELRIFYSFKAIYICGVIKKGYSQKKNYPHNVHAAIIPKKAAKDTWEFEGWKLEVENGVFSHIPSIEELPLKYRSLPEEFITCRIYRWAIGYFYSDKGEENYGK